MQRIALTDRGGKHRRVTENYGLGIRRKILGAEIIRLFLLDVDDAQRNSPGLLGRSGAIHLSVINVGVIGPGGVESVVPATSLNFRSPRPSARPRMTRLREPYLVRPTPTVAI